MKYTQKGCVTVSTDKEKYSRQIENPKPNFITVMYFLLFPVSSLAIPTIPQDLLDLTFPSIVHVRDKRLPYAYVYVC